MAAKAVAIVAVDVKRWSEAISEAQQGAFVNARSAFVHSVVGKVFEANGNFDQATQSYQKALEADPGFVAARLALVSVQNLRGDTEGSAGRGPEAGEGPPRERRRAPSSWPRPTSRPRTTRARNRSSRRPRSCRPGMRRHTRTSRRSISPNGKDQVALESYKKALALKPDNARGGATTPCSWPDRRARRKVSASCVRWSTRPGTTTRRAS